MPNISRKSIAIRLACDGEKSDTARVHDMRYASSIAKIPTHTEAVPLPALAVPALARQSATSDILGA